MRTLLVRSSLLIGVLLLFVQGCAGVPTHRTSQEILAAHLASTALEDCKLWTVKDGIAIPAGGCTFSTNTTRQSLKSDLFMPCPFDGRYCAPRLSPSPWYTGKFGWAH